MAIFSDSHPQQHLPITLTLVNKTKPRLQRETQNQRLLSASSSHFFFLLLLIFALNSLFLFLFFSFFSLWKFFIVVVYCDFLGFRSTIAGNHGFSGESFVTPLSLSPCMIRVTVVASRFLSSTMAFSECTSHFQSLGLFNSCSPFGYRENITAKQVKKKNRVFFFFFGKDFKWFWIGITRLSRVKQNLRLGVVFSSLFFLTLSR